MRSYVCCVLVVIGCSGKSDADGEVPPDPKGWTITVDMSGLDRYVTPDHTTWSVGGIASATEGLAGVDVAGLATEVDTKGAFTATVPVMPGLVRVPILARDAAGHERKADRTLLVSRFLADGAHNAAAASLVLDDAILASMSEGIVGQAGTVDVAGEILARDVLSQDDRCVTWPVSGQQGAVIVKLVEDTGDLWLNIRIPNLYIYFEGECQGVFSIIPIAGEFGGTIDVWSKLDARAPTDSCITAFDHTTPQVQILGWGFDVWGQGGPLQNWIVSMFEGEKATEAKTQITGEVRTRADTMLGEKLANISVFDRSSELELLGRPIAMHLCLGALDKVGTQLIARVAAAASSAGTREAPGAPQLDGAAPATPANELVLDGNLIAQLLFASWRDGGLTRAAPDVDAGILQVLVPQLAERWPDATTVNVAIEGELPPLVRATPDGPGDLVIELGDLMVELAIDGTAIFRFNVALTLELELVPTAGKLAPKVLETKATVALIDELYDGPDAALEQAVQSQIGATASQLLGDTAAIALPDLPGLGAPVDVTADAGGRFLHVTLQK